MRTTIDLPDALYRKAKATAALRGSTIKELVLRAVEREVNGRGSPGSLPVPRVKLPIHLKSGRKLDLSNFDFDDLLT